MRRIQAMKSQIRNPDTRNAGGAAADAPILLTDAQVKKFIVHGFLALPIKELGSAFHKSIYDKTKDAFGRFTEEKQDPRLVFGELPEMTDVINSPTLRGAMTSVLGSNYVQHPHRSMHTKPLHTTTGKRLNHENCWSKYLNEKPWRYYGTRCTSTSTVPF